MQSRFVRRHRHRRRPRRLRGGVGRGPARLPRRAVHAVARDGGADAVQSGDRRHGEGPSRPRDRRAGRTDGPRHRRDRHPVQAAQSQPRAGGVVAARAGGQAALRRMGARARSRREPNITWLFRRAGPDSDDGRPRHGPRVRGRRRGDVRRARRHDRHVPQRARAHRRRAAAGGPRRRAADARAGRVAARLRLRDGPAQDRHAAAARSAHASISRDSPKSAATIRSCRSRFVERPIDARRRSPATSLHTTDARARRSCARTSADRRSTTARSTASARDIARRSKTR